MLFAPFDGWDMQPYQRLDDATWTHGGVRSMMELAAGLAAIGLDVELRGGFAEREVAAMEDAAGVQLGRPSARRRPQLDELVIVPEGHDDPLIFARVALSGARAVLMMLGPLGLVGWPFDGTPIPEADEILTLDTETVGRPESLAAARSFGLELWTNAPAIAARGASGGVDVKYIGSGRPAPYPEPGEKSVDVLALAENRWGPLALEALEAVPAQFKKRMEPGGNHAGVLAALSAARVFLHPARIEGRSRLCEEARAMRAVPVLLASNSNGEGYGQEYGSVVVDSVQDMAVAAAALLDDPEHLATLAESGYRTARQDGDWEAYKQRLRDAIAAPDLAVAAETYVRSRVGVRATEEHLRVLHERDAIASERDAIASERDRLAAEGASLRERIAALWAQLDKSSELAQELSEALAGILSSSSWRLTKPLRATMAALRALLRMSRA
ncbi:MAG: glycosyltransferase [Solirubrobacteraceae bacterium]